MSFGTVMDANIEKMDQQRPYGIQRELRLVNVGT